MGNVSASSKVPQAPPLQQPVDPSPPQIDPTNVTKLEGPPPPSDNMNPGPMDDLHKRAKEVFPMAFEGLRFAVNKNLSNHFQVQHVLNVSTTNPAQSAYKFGATYVGTQVGPGEAYPVLMGDLDPSGNLTANAVHLFNKNLLGKMMYRIQSSKMVAMQTSLDYRGYDYTASITGGNLDFVNNSGVLVAHYLQSMSKKVALGSELVYQYGPNVPGYHMAILNFVGRYQQDDFALSGTIGSSGIHTCFYQKCSETLQVGVELETNFRHMESVATVGYQVDIPKSNFTFKGSLDSNWTASAVIEKKLLPLPFSLSLSGTLNQRTNQFRLGLGFIIG